MYFKIISGLLGLGMFLAFMLPPVIKLQRPALALVVLIGVAMAAYEFYEQLRSKDD